MRKSLLILLQIIMFAMPLFAERVDEKTAQKVAETFLKSKMQGKTDLKLNQIAYANRADFSNFYVFGGENCFVIVSADDCVKPILGYSSENPFGTEAMPENVYGWLKDYDEEIDYAIKNGFRVNEEIRKEWNSLKTGEVPTVKSMTTVQPLVTAHWYQGSPCNGQCPVSSSNQQAIVGCVATAMAQVMHRWKFPDFGSDSYSYYHAIFGAVSADFGATTYDWNNMPDRIYSNSSTAQKTAVATLMYHCGVSVNMDYGVDGSGSQTSSIASSLVGFFGYDENIKYVEKKNFSDNAWISLLKSELDAGRPMCYGAQDDNGRGGHAFVCDGYDENDKFHINWGWNSSDGYFQMGALNPSSYQFNKDQGAVIGIQPAQYLRTSYKKMRVPASDGSQILKILASQDLSSWSAVSNNPWITLSQTEGEGDGQLSTISVHVDANTGTLRTGSITVSQGGSSVEVLVLQDAASECETHNDDKSMLAYYTVHGGDEVNYPMLGNNPFFSACAEKVVATGWSKLSSVTYRYVIFDDEGSVTLKVWDSDGTDGSPGSVLAERTVSMKEMMSNGGLYIWGFEIPMTVNGTFYVGYETTNAISAINLFSSTANQYAENTVWVKYGSWCSISSVFNETFTSSILTAYCEATTYLVEAEVNPSNGGCVSGDGNIIEYEMATLTAEAEEGYAFVNWTENGRVVSDDSEYSFMVLEDRTLVANFVNCTPNVFEHDGNWTNPENWSLGHAPSQSGEIAVIKANAVSDADVTVEALSVKNEYVLTISGGRIFTVSDGIYNMKPSNLILENNAQLIHNTPNVQATVKKSITGYGSGDGNWYLIASPMVNNTDATELMTGDYDLYSYYEPTHYWLNSKDLISGFNTLANGTGYLYANSAGCELSLSGELQPSVNDVDIPLSYTSSLNTLRGFNLIGNPFPCKANVSGNIATDFYVMNTDRDELVISTDNTVNPLEGIFVQATGENANAAFSRVESNAKGRAASSCFDIIVNDGRSEIDRARVRFGEGQGLGKFSLNDNSARIYFPIDKQDYASVFVSNQKVLPLNFKPAKKGTYTLNFDLDNVDLEYLHLIDNLTGSDVDLMAAAASTGSASYSFDSKLTDYPSRFKLVFAENEQLYEAIDSDFLYYADGQFFVFSTDGKGIIEIIDATGRLLMTENANGYFSKSMSLKSGVYVARLISDKTVKTQKFVVK